MISKNEIQNSRFYLDNNHKPIPSCMCQKQYRKPLSLWRPIDPNSVYHENLEEFTTVINDNIFQLPVLFYDFYNWGYDHRNYFNWKTRYANEEKCGCGYRYDDSKLNNTEEYRRYNSIIFNEEFCQADLNDRECNYDLKKNYAFDIAIENYDKNGCVICYSVDKGWGFI